MYKFSHTNEDPGLSPSNHIVHTHGQYLGGPDDGLEKGNNVGSFTDVHVNDDLEFDIEFEVFLGRARRRERLIAQPGAINAFMVNVRAASQEEDQELADTAVTFQGVITAGRRFTHTSATLRRDFLFGP